jgi:hypothetical protein|tara:strand:+ start:1871 stop:2071 length:201 start_codon:yes stop_codon:yes gene_type:complete
MLSYLSRIRVLSKERKSVVTQEETVQIERIESLASRIQKTAGIELDLLLGGKYHGQKGGVRGQRTS